LRFAAAVIGLLLLTGCQVKATVGVHAEADGSGRVEVIVVLDRAAVARVPDLELRTDDLARAGWEIEGPTRQARGGLRIGAKRRFRSPAEAERLIAQVSGAGGVLEGFALERERSFLRTRMRLTGTLDLTDGVARFSDSDLAERLGGQPLGLEPAQLTAVDEALRVEVVGDLPGKRATWQAKAGERVRLVAEGEQLNLGGILFAVLAVLCAAATALTFRRTRRVRRVRVPPPSP
jgi:hypothetical protein